MITLVALVAGGLGAVTRFVVDGEVARRWRRSFPAGTFLVNVTGSLIIGILAGAVMYHGRSADWQTVLGTGFCGGYTTFSTASVETVRLFRSGRYAVAALNAVGSLVASMAACALGLAAAWAL